MNKKPRKPRSPKYEAAKTKKNLTLTPTAIAWLESRREEAGATSISDLIERWARSETQINK